MIRQMLRRWRRPAVTTSAELGTFIDQGASLIAQKTVMGYVTVKTMLPLHELTREKQFADAFEISRWEAYAAALSDVVMVTEGHLRAAAEGRVYDLAARLAALHARVVNGHPAPAHRAEGWAGDVAAMDQRLRTAQLAPPKAMADIALAGAERIYATLPIHERLREPDKPAIVANVQFMMVGLAHRFNAEFDSEAIVADLLEGVDAQRRQGP